VVHEGAYRFGGFRPAGPADQVKRDRPSVLAP
jgi:hypothetical protein